jgi:hypothetical protein
MLTVFWWGNEREGDALEDLRFSDRIILNRFSKIKSVGPAED